MLIGYIFCIQIKSKSASDVIRTYIDNLYAKFGGSIKLLSGNGTKFKNELFSTAEGQLGVEFKIYHPLIVLNPMEGLKVFMPP